MTDGMISVKDGNIDVSRNREREMRERCGKDELMDGMIEGNKSDIDQRHKEW